MKISSLPFVAELHVPTFNYCMYIGRHSHGREKADKLYGDSKAGRWCTQVRVHFTGMSWYCTTAWGLKDAAKAVGFPLSGRKVSHTILKSSSLEYCWQTVFCFPFSRGMSLWEQHLSGRWFTVFVDYIFIHAMNVQTMAAKERSWLSVLCISSFQNVLALYSNTKSYVHFKVVGFHTLYNLLIMWLIKAISKYEEFKRFLKSEPYMQNYFYLGT